ncbi:hypothetical protein D3C71_1919450 [compost metagenome]
MIKQLEGDKVITVHRPVSKRLPTYYTFNNDIEDFLVEESKDEQIVYLQELVRELTEKTESLEKEKKALQGQVKISNNKLIQFGEVAPTLSE